MPNICAISAGYIQVVSQLVGPVLPPGHVVLGPISPLDMGS